MLFISVERSGGKNEIDCSRTDVGPTVLEAKRRQMRGLSKVEWSSQFSENIWETYPHAEVSDAVAGKTRLPEQRNVFKRRNG